MVKKITEISRNPKVEKNTLIGKISFTDGIFLIKCKTLNTKKKLNIFLERLSEWNIVKELHMTFIKLQRKKEIVNPLSVNHWDNTFYIY